MIKMENKEPIKQVNTELYSLYTVSYGLFLTTEAERKSYSISSHLFGCGEDIEKEVFDITSDGNIAEKIFAAVVNGSVTPTTLQDVIEDLISDPDGIPYGISDEIPNEIPNGISDGFPNGIPNGISNGIPNGIPNGV